MFALLAPLLFVGALFGSAEDHALVEAAAGLERRWGAELSRLEEALAEPPPAGGDYGWMLARRLELGEDAGLALYDEKEAEPLAWSGRTTLLGEEERAILTDRLDAGLALLVLRRGLSLRLLLARRCEVQPGTFLAAERPLPPEPEAGWLAPDEGGVVARARWESLGEGLRAELDTGPAEERTMWSIVPLMGPQGRVAGRVSLGAPSAAERRGDALRALAGGFGGLAGLALVAWAFVWPARALVALPLARLALLPTSAWLDALGVRVANEWPLVRLPLLDSPLDAALTGLTLVALVGVMPRLGRWPSMVAGVLLLAAGAWVAGFATSEAALPALEPLVPNGLFAPTRELALVFALSALAWCGALVLGRAAGLRGEGALLLLAALGGLVAGAAHARQLEPAAKERVAARVVPEFAERRTLWEEALEGTLALAVPPPGADTLAPERDAIDLWWSGPLGQIGLASATWKIDAEGELVDAFVTGFPPLMPTPGGPSIPERVALPFVGGSVELLVAEVERPGGGRWMAAVLAEPGNLPIRAPADLLLGARAPRIERLPLVPRLAWFDAEGTLLGADMEAPPPPPPLPLAEPRWRELELAGAGLRALEVPGPQGGGSVVAVIEPPTAGQELAIALGWAATLGLGAAALALARLAARVQGLSALARSLRVQVAAGLALAGLVPLLALGASGRAQAHDAAIRQLQGAGTREVAAASRFVEEYLAASGNATLDDAVTAWIARTLGRDLFVWEEGTLVATSRRDLVRAGLWPERLAGETWQTIARRREAFEVARVDTVTVFHGPFRTPGGGTGVVSVPVPALDARVDSELAAYDRALVVAIALLAAAAGAVLVPAARRIARPLVDLQRATSQLSRGEFDTPIPETGIEETRALARAFRVMAESIATQQRSLERRRAAMEALIASMPVAVLALTEEGRIWSANPLASELFPEAESLGEDELAALEAEPERHLRVASIALPAGRPGEPARLVVIEDLTDTIRSERIVAWAGMARRIAHEIKNPLTPISLVVDHARRLAAERDPNFHEVLERCFATIADQVRVLRDTSREFSDYARLIEAAPETLDLPAELERWTEAYRIAPPPGVVVRLEGPGSLPPLVADPRLLRRAMVNLLDNALGALGEEGGEVLVAWRLLGGEEPRVEIRIADTGPGIDPERAERLFEPDVTTRETGSGLGLPIARQAIEAQGGTLVADPAPGTRGAAFVITLPLTAA